MYLSMLDNEKKHLFLELEIYMSKIDGDFSREEKEIINVHCMEMHIDNNDFECEYSIDELLANLKDALTLQEKRIFFLELVGIILADGVYDGTERDMSNKLSEIFEIDEKGVNEAFQIIQDMKDVYERCAKYIK